MAITLASGRATTPRRLDWPPSDIGHSVDTGESCMTITPSGISRAAGMSAMGSGLLYIVIQPIHPEESGRATSSADRS